MKKILSLLAALIPAAAVAAVPPQIQFEGLFSSTGTIPTLEFRVVDSPASDAALEGWTESTAPFTSDGRVSLLLGTQTPLPAALFSSPSVDRYLWVKVGAEAPARQKLVSVPYAFRAGTADALAGGAVVQGLVAEKSAQALRVRGNYDQFLLEEIDGPADQKQWITKADEGNLSLLTANDAYNSFGEFMKVTRSGLFADRILFPSAAKVGIGTYAPQRELEVNGSFRVTGTGINKDIELNSPIRATVLPFGPNVPADQDFQIRSAGNGTMQINNDNPGGISLAVGGGAVGVGTFPSAFDKMTVAGTVRSTSGGFRFPDGTLQATAAGGGIKASDNLVWTGTHAWTQTGSFQGKLGVGTNAPAAALDVVGPDFQQIRVRRPGSGFPSTLLWAGTNSGIVEVDNAASQEGLGIAFDGVESAKFTKAGNLGLGVHFPQYKLDVNGAVNATDVLKGGVSLVSSQWANVSAGVKYAGGDAAVVAAGKGVILKATNGPNCFRVTVNNAGALSTASVACP